MYPLEADVEVIRANSNLTAPSRNTAVEQASDINATIDLGMQGNTNTTGSVSIECDANIRIAHPAPLILPDSDAVRLLLSIAPTPELSSHISHN